MSARAVVLSSATARTLVLVLGIALALGTAMAADYTVIRNPDGTYTTVPPEGLPVTPQQFVAEPPSGPPTFVDYVSAAAGSWGTSTNWTPNGVPSAGSREVAAQLAFIQSAT